MRVLTLSAIALAGFAAVQTAPAQPADAWQLAQPSDILGVSMRNPKTWDLSAEADFDGDGLSDRVTIQKNAATKQFGVFVCFAGRGADTCSWTLVRSGPIAHLKTLGVSAVSPNSQECRKLGLPGQHKAACIDVFAQEASSTFYKWNGRSFVARTMGD